MPVPLNFTLPSPTELTTPLKGFNMGLQTLQNMVQAKYADQMAQADIAQKSMSNLPPLDAALMAYQRASAQYGEGHPITQQMQQNYQLMYDKENTLKNYQDVLAGAKDFSSMPDEVKRATMAAVAARGGSFPELGQGVPLGGNAQGSPSFPAPAHVQTSQAAINNAQALPMTQQQLAANQRNFGKSGMALTPQDTARLQAAGVAQPGVVQPGVVPNAGQIYQQSYSPEGKANIEVGAEAEKAKKTGNIDIMNKILYGKDGNAGYIGAGISTQSALNSLNQFKADYDAAPAFAKGAIMGKYFGSLSPEGQAAMKNSLQLAFNQMASMKGVNNRWNISEWNALLNGNPNITMDPKAVARIAGEMTAALKMTQQQGRLANALRGKIDDPGDLQNIIEQATVYYNPVNKDGQVDDSDIDKVMNFAKPEAIAKIKAGEKYYPDENAAYGARVGKGGQALSMEDFEQAAQKSGLPLRAIIKEFDMRAGKR